MNFSRSPAGSESMSGGQRVDVRRAGGPGSTERSHRQCPGISQPGDGPGRPALGAEQPVQRRGPLVQVGRQDGAEADRLAEQRMTVQPGSELPGLLETPGGQDPRRAVRVQDLLDPVDHGDRGHAAIHDPLQPRLDLQPRQPREGRRHQDTAHDEAAHRPLRRPPHDEREAGNANRRRARGRGIGRGFVPPAVPPLAQHPHGRQDEQRQRQTEQETQAARQAEMQRHRVRRGRRDEERPGRRDAAGDDAAAGTRQGPPQRLFERTAMSQFLPLAHEQVDGEVDAETEHGDAEERLHHGQLPGQEADGAQRGADREHQNRRHRQHAARPLLDDPEEKQHEHEADRRQALDRAQGLLLVARRQRRQAREAGRHSRAGERALDRRLEFEEGALAHLLRQGVRRHLDLDQSGARHTAHGHAKRRRGGQELRHVLRVARLLGEGEPTVEQRPFDEPRRLFREPFERQRPAGRGDRRKRRSGLDRAVDGLVESLLLALEQNQEQTAELVPLGHLEVAADVFVVAIHHPHEGEIDRRRR